MPTNPTAAIHGLTTNRSNGDEPHHEDERGQADAAREMRVEIRAPDLLDQLGVLFGQASFDLFEDPLLVIAEGHETCSPVGRGVNRPHDYREPFAKTGSTNPEERGKNV